MPFTEYGKDGNYFRAGYMLGYYSIDQSTSTNDLIFNTASNVAETFYPDRRIGVSYTRSLPSYYLSAGAFCGDGLSFSETTKPGYNFSGRIVWRPINSSGQLLHIGTGALFKVPDEDTETQTQQIRLKSKGVTYIPSPRTLELTVGEARNRSSLTWNACSSAINGCFRPSFYIRISTVRTISPPIPPMAAILWEVFC